ncbi:trace amine-associated receptor 1-like [Salarias fasciatus]|uniref:trace amine-associated receptor 1-like n=1 Tax=Salarias fasciatus TaxID=181472 RepID=UPI001176ECB3|nr:trace amine-associated receptor 1-like [Salarias fasciatus]
MIKTQELPRVKESRAIHQNTCDWASVTVTSYLLCAFVGSLSVLVTCGNCLVIISIMYFKQLHTPTNYLILSLAVADLLVGIIVLPFSTVLSVTLCWDVTGLLCKVRGFFDMLLCTSSILNLCFISIDRYFVVCQPLTYRTKMNTRVTGIMILVSWAVPAVLSIGIALRDRNRQQSAASNMKCDIYQNTQSTLAGAIFAFYLPAVIILSIYLKILMVAHRQARSIQIMTKSGAAVSKMERKATKTLAVVVGVFLMSWTPFFLSITCHSLTNYSLPGPVLETLKWFGWSNSMLNPLVYGLFYSWFRRAFKMIISGKVFQGDCSNSKLF